MKSLLSLACLAAAFYPQPIQSQTVRFTTNQGDILVNLTPDKAPNTVANFLHYMNSGVYNNSFIHRSVQSSIFVVQGGGFRYIDGNVYTIAPGPPILNEFNVSNTRGTIAMALSGSASGGTDPNSATTQWFFNNKDNSSALDSQDFTVFGTIDPNDSASLAVLDQIAALTTTATPYFPSLPLVNYTAGSTITQSNLVLVTNISVVQSAPVLGIGGAITASGFGAFGAAAPGSFIEIYGTNLAASTRGWGASDFVNGAAPTMLDGVSVTVNGEPAYVNFVSPNQINVQLPGDLAPGPAAVIVTYGTQSSGPIALTINALQGGLLAPPSFNVGGKQYTAAIHVATGQYVGNGNISGVSTSPAVAGETLVFYGTGFGPVTPVGTLFAGQIANGLTALVNPVQFTFGSTPATVTYNGLAPGEVGLYQFNVTVPSGLTSGDVPLTVTQAGTAIAQTLFITVQ